MTIRVKIYNDGLDVGIRVLKRKMFGEGVIASVRNKYRFTRPCDQRRQEREAAFYNRQKELRMENFSVLMRKLGRGF